MQTDRTALIRALNDRLRVERIGGRIMLTRGIVAFGPGFVAEVVRQLTTFDQFAAANDPYDEHDFGGMEIEGQWVFWKIDYYDQSLSQAAADPSDQRDCVRLLTVMLAEEY
jgi:hypothetical protein